ncbi:Os07g0227650 [Oryza sativa Japonica Group]|uniref:Os07g0227650 protein n=1 Tax=Oryza sativa subsp. japonica TaxID=39947 RepID=A0A0P0X3X9_ORYSJ|nr:Os07g0227650 [Oryza sativa Japonica Group]
MGDGTRGRGGPPHCTSHLHPSPSPDPSVAVICQVVASMMASHGHERRVRAGDSASPPLSRRSLLPPSPFWLLAGSSDATPWTRLLIHYRAPDGHLVDLIPSGPRAGLAR